MQIRKHVNLSMALIEIIVVHIIEKYNKIVTQYVRGNKIMNELIDNFQMGTYALCTN
jgi:hypothetical protein